MNPIERPRIRIRIVDGRWVPMQALSPMSAAAWEQMAAETRDTLKRQREVKMRWEMGERS